MTMFSFASAGSRIARGAAVLALSAAVLAVAPAIVAPQDALATEYKIPIGTVVDAGYGGSAVPVKANVARAYHGTEEGIVYQGTAFGSTDVNRYWISVDEDGNETDGQETDGITVTGGTYDKTKCDALFKGKKYSIMGLLCSINNVYNDNKDDEFYGVNQVYTSYMYKKGGRFQKGIGYKVTGKGKYITFTKTGKVTVKYKYKGKTYKMKFLKVRSKATLVKSIGKKVKASESYADSYKVVSSKYFTKNCARGVSVKYTMKTTDGEIVTKTAKGWYEGGCFRYKL